MTVYGIVGQSLETTVISGDYTPSAAEIEMSEPRPSPVHIAQADGTWALPGVTAAEVKLEAQRRIDASGLPWLVQREVSGGAPIPETVKSYAGAVRAASNEIEALDPIPENFRDDSYWPEVVA